VLSTTNIAKFKIDLKIVKRPLKGIDSENETF